jgi:hypothetical protein
LIELIVEFHAYLQIQQLVLVKVDVVVEEAKRDSVIVRMNTFDDPLDKAVILSISGEVDRRLVLAVGNSSDGPKYIRDKRKERRKK